MTLEQLNGKKFDLHVHTVFSDGKNSPEEMVESAIAKGLDALGFSDHSYTFFDERYCVPKGRINEYISKISDLKEKYKNKIEIFCGIEQDFFSSEETSPYDYRIVSVHYLKEKDGYFPIDDSKECITFLRDKYYSGDIYALAEDYFETISQTGQEGPTIVGHFDYITLYNEDSSLFDENNPRYINAWKKAVDKLNKKGVTFEINTGGIIRKGKRNPYPSPEIIRYIKDHGGKLIYSSDCHNAKDVAGFLLLDAVYN